MPDVISLLERLGEDAALRGVALERTFSDAPIDPALKAAIQSADQRMLERLLGAQTNVCCGLHPAKEDEEEDDEEERHDDDDGDDDAEEDDLKAQRFAAVSRAASRF